MYRASPLGLSPGFYEQPRVSPDGKRLAFVTDDGENASIWMYDLGRAAVPRRLTTTGRNRLPVWSPDSQRLAFQSDREGDIAIFVQRADGAGRAERLTRPEKEVVHIPEVWSKSEQALVYSEARGDESVAWLYRFRDGRSAPLADVRSSVLLNIALSPDERWMVYTKSNTAGVAGPLMLARFPEGGGTPYELVQKGNQGLWSADGKRIFLNPGPGEMVSVEIATTPLPSWGSPVALTKGFTQGGPLRPRNYTIAPDGRFIGVVGAGQATTSAMQTVQVILNWFGELETKVPTRGQS